jgi:hypothetical protein
MRSSPTKRSQSCTYIKYIDFVMITHSFFNFQAFGNEVPRANKILRIFSLPLVFNSQRLWNWCKYVKSIWVCFDWLAETSREENELVKQTALKCWSATEMHWRKKLVSRGGPVKSGIRWPSSDMKSWPVPLMGPIVLKASGKRRYAPVMSVLLLFLFLLVITVLIRSIGGQLWWILTPPAFYAHAK